MQTIRITSISAIKNSRFIYNDDTVLDLGKEQGEVMLKLAYEALGVNYPKFYKMDNMCKTATIASHLLLQKMNISDKYKPEEVAIVLSTANGCIDTDLKYWESTKTAPSPSLFVYTLPNIAVGEISIKYGIKGESACFVADTFDSDFQSLYTEQLFKTGNVKCCISGWVDFFQDKAEAFFYLAEYSNDNSLIIHDKNFLLSKYEDLCRS